MAETEGTAAAPALQQEEGKKESSGRKLWFPLESNPDVMNKYVGNLGFPTKDYQFYDVLSTEDWALAMVPQPALAVLLLYPIKEAAEKHRKEEAERIKTDGQEVSKNLYFSKQTVGNACGTVALLHSVANNRGQGGAAQGMAFWARFIEKNSVDEP